MLLIALYTDWRWRKIFNNLTFPCMATGIILNVLDGRLGGFLSSIGGAALVIALFLVLAPAAGIGGGDTKLMVAVGAIMGLHFTVSALIYTGLAGGILALIVMARHRVMVRTTRSLFVNLYSKAVLNAPINLATGGSGIKFKYSLAIVVGTVLAFVRPIWN